MKYILWTLLVFCTIALSILYYDARNKITVEATPLTAKTYSDYCQKEGISYIPYIQWSWITNPKDIAIVYKKKAPITGLISYDIEP